MSRPDPNQKRGFYLNLFLTFSYTVHRSDLEKGVIQCIQNNRIILINQVKIHRTAFQVSRITPAIPYVMLESPGRCILEC